MKDPLFEPIHIGAMQVKNRICMPAMHLNLARDFKVTDRLIDFYAARARGGAGLICAGFATVNALAGTTMNIGAHDDAFIPGLSRLAEAIRENGARSAIQINHAGRYNMSFFIEGRQPVAPSAVPSRMTGETPHALTIEEIEQTIDDFAGAALRVKKAGFDAVEVLSGTGYLISEFLSPLTNRRDDEYGGSLVNRMRFGRRVLAAVRAAVGEDFPIIYRINGNDLMAGGQGPEELREYAEALDGDGVNALCVNVGWHEARVPQIISSVPRGVFAYLSRKIRERVSAPVIASHRINDPGVARELIGDGMCDMVAMGRSLIADPDLPVKAAEGRESEIVHCIACAQGCFDNLFKLKSVECLCNPRACREAETVIERTAAPRKVMVAGGGPAGMSAALAAWERGHRVTLYERSDRLGGQLHLAAAPPGRAEFAVLARDLAGRMAAAGIPIALNRAVDAALIAGEKPDFVIAATGAAPLTLPIPGADLPHVASAWDVLSDKVWTGSRVAVIGGGAVGVETALFLADKGTLSGEALKFLLVNRAADTDTLYDLATRGTREVTVIEMMDKVGMEIGKSTRWAMLQEMERAGIRVVTVAKALEISEVGVRIETADGEELIPADTVVMAAGAKPFNSLEQILKEAGVDYRVIGDARRIGRAFEAIHAGFAAGREVA